LDKAEAALDDAGECGAEAGGVGSEARLRDAVRLDALGRPVESIASSCGNRRLSLDDHIPRHVHPDRLFRIMQAQVAFVRRSPPVAIAGPVAYLAARFPKA